MVNIEYQKFKRNYVYVNIVFLLLALYVIFFPFISDVFYNLFAGLKRCGFYILTGRPCPLCGGTRYIANIKNALYDISYLFCPFGFITIFVILELFFRIFLLLFFKVKIFDAKTLKYLANFDLIFHVLVFLLFILYELIYILKIY